MMMAPSSEEINVRYCETY